MSDAIVKLKLKSKRKGEVLFHNNHHYLKDGGARPDKDIFKVFWRCRTRGCKGRVKSTRTEPEGEDIEIRETGKAHSCPVVGAVEHINLQARQQYIERAAGGKPTVVYIGRFVIDTIICAIFILFWHRRVLIADIVNGLHTGTDIPEQYTNMQGDKRFPSKLSMKSAVCRKKKELKLLHPDSAGAAEEIHSSGSQAEKPDSPPIPVGLPPAANKAATEAEAEALAVLMVVEAAVVGDHSGGSAGGRAAGAVSIARGVKGAARLGGGDKTAAGRKTGDDKQKATQQKQSKRDREQQRADDDGQGQEASSRARAKKNRLVTVHHVWARYSLLFLP
jgi:hypothetical protein